MKFLPENKYHKAVLLLPFILVIGLLVVFLPQETADEPLGAIANLEINGRDTSFAFTDDNTGEDLIIKSSAEDYYGFGSVAVPFAIQNTSGKRQKIKVVVSTSNGQETKKIQRWLRNDTITHMAVNTATTTIPAWEEVVTVWEDDTSKSFTGGGAITRKSVEDKNSDIESGWYIIGRNETLYFRTSINFSKEGKFYIEAIGDEGAYGHLDPNAFGAEETFESYADGDLDGENETGTGWSGAWATQGTAVTDVQSTVAYDGSNGIEMVASGWSYASRALTSDIDGDFVLYVAIRTGQINSDGARFAIRNTADSGRVYIQFDQIDGYGTTGDFGLFGADTVTSSNWTVMVEDYSADTWYLFRITGNPDTGAYTGAYSTDAYGTAGTWSSEYSQTMLGTGDLRYIAPTTETTVDDYYWDYISYVDPFTAGSTYTPVQDIIKFQ